MKYKDLKDDDGNLVVEGKDIVDVYYILQYSQYTHPRGNTHYYLTDKGEISREEYKFTDKNEAIKLAEEVIAHHQKQRDRAIELGFKEPSPTIEYPRMYLIEITIFNKSGEKEYYIKPLDAFCVIKGWK